MDPRRINDTLKIVGSCAATLASLAPFVAALAAVLPPQYAAIAAALGAYLAGLGTRGAGLEYRDVAEAKVKASMVPPALSVMPAANATVHPEAD